MNLKIESPQGEEPLTEFVLFKDRATEGISAHWPAVVEMQVPVLTGESPFCEDREIRSARTARSVRSPPESAKRSSPGRWR